MMRAILICFGVLLGSVASPALAVEPSEMLADPALEARAQALDAEIRCIKCQSEAIASSNAEWAADARIASRELIAAGKTDAEVLTFFVERYGEFVLMRPNASGANWLLWAAGPLMLLLAGGTGLAYVRGRARAPGLTDQGGLNSAESARLKEILKE